MEKMPFVEALHAVLPAMEYPAAHDTTTTDWRRQLPVLSAGRSRCGRCAPTTPRRSARC